jgi:cytochrome c biogenesis protein CcmG/thiol:disulfide interchange protein DsbE
MTITHSIASKSGPGENACRRARTGFAWLAALVLISASILTAAEEVKLNSIKVGSRTYRRVTILGVSETDLYFRHASGISNVKLRNLSPELQKRFDYDPKAAEEAERRQIAEDSAYFETVAVDVATRAQKAAAAAKAEAELASKRAASTEASLADPLSGKSLVNQPAPKLEFGRWLGEKPNTDGKAMLIFFWTTWSIPCRKAIAEMNSLYKKFRDQIVVIGWSAQEETEVAEFSDVKIDFPLATDPNGVLAGTAGVDSVPQVLLIDDRGVVRYVGHPAALNAAALKKLLAAPAE